MKLKLNEKSILRRPWLLLSIGISFICAVIMLLVFDYWDGRAYISWSVELLDCIFRKTTMGFYEYSGLDIRENVWYIGNSDKTILMLLPIAIWNIPVWIVHEINGNPIVTGSWNIAWMKLGFLLCIVVIAVECSKIVKKVNPEADHLLVYPLVFGSFDVLCSTMYAAQDEVVYLMLFVIAMRLAVDNKFKGFLIVSSLAVALNVEMIIPALLIMVFFEKRILRIFLYLIIVYIPTEAFNLIYRNNELFHSHTLVQSDLIRGLFTTDISFSQGVGNVSLFLFVLCVLLFFTYTKKQEQTKPYDLTWIMAVYFVSRTLLSSGGLLNFFYRSLLYVPFLVVLVLVSKQNSNTTLLLCGLFTWCRGWLCVISDYPQNMSMNYLSFENEYIQRAVDKNGWINMGRFFGYRIPMLNNYGVITVACLALAFVLLFITHRSKEDDQYVTISGRKDIIVFFSCLFTPLVLALFAFMMMKADTYNKRILFGSDKVAYCVEDLHELEYEDPDYIHVFTNYLAYESNICVDKGEDKNGARYLFPEGGTSFGPYIRLYPGEYRISVYGQNLDNLSYDCTYSNGVDVFSIPLETEATAEGCVIYTINVEQTVDNVETRFFDWSDEPVIIYCVDIAEID